MYEILHHTADIRIKVTAATMGDLFSDALKALMEVLGADETSAPPEEESIELESIDTTSLLVDFLNDVLVRAVVRRRAYTGVIFSSLQAARLSATLTSVPAGSFEEDVKAVTYHEAEVRRGGDGWTTTLVLDI